MSKEDHSSAILFTDKHGHVIRLARSMTLRELLKMGTVSIEKPDVPLRDEEYRSTPETEPLEIL